MGKFGITAIEGLPQESPELFNIFATDVPRITKDLYSLRMTVVLMKGINVSQAKGVSELRSLMEYVTRWKIKLNIEQAEAVRLGSKRAFYPFLNFAGIKDRDGGR